MSHLRGIRILVRILPFRSPWSARLRRHLEHCQRCQAGMISLDEASAATIPQQRIKEGKDFWPELVHSLKRAKSLKPSGPRLRRRWALAAAGFIAVAIGLFLLKPGEKDDLASAIKLRIQSIKIYDQPAQAFIFEIPDANRTFVWVEKQETGEVL
jgi:hypothetical protein